MVPVRAILDTGAGPNLIREEVLPEDWERSRLPGTPAYQIIGAGGRPLRQKGVIAMHVQLGTLRVQSRFVVVTSLAAECILGCQFINRHVRMILPKEKRVVLTNDNVVSILQDSADRPDSGKVPSPEQVSSPPVPSSKVRVAHLTVVPPRAEVCVDVHCAAPGLCFLQALASGNSLGVYMANGIADILPNTPFQVRVINTSDRARKIPKGMILGHALPHPTGIIALADDEGSGGTYRKMSEEGPSPSPEDVAWFSLRQDPPPVPDRPDVEGETWKEDLDLAHLTPQERKNVYQMLGTHRSMWDGRLGHVQTTSHRIELVPDARPVHAQPYRAGSRAREAESSEVQRMLKAGVIEPTASEWASPVVLVPKPDGSMRFCIDYRRLNALTVRDSYPLPRMEECIDSLGDATIFSTLDCNSGYWQIPVHPDDRAKTTFTSHEGLYRFLRMPFGLRNAPATFQRFVDITLAGLTWKICLVYLDDIIIFSKTKEEHLSHLDAVLHRLYRAGLSLNLKKCYFFRDTVSYLGHVIRPGQLTVADKNTHALKTAKPPTTQSELRSFLGLCNVYRRFVAGFAKIAAPLNALLRKGENPQFGTLSEEQLAAFETLRTRLLDPPILALPRAEGLFILDTDASQEQIGCCLFQEQASGTRHPVGYWSRGLTSAERNYSTTEKECLAIVWAILQLRPYLEGKHFIIRTDHNSLRWVLNLADAQGRLARWRLRLLEFDFEVQYAPGKEHHGADTLSRLRPSDPSLAEPATAVDTEIPCFEVSRPTFQFPPPVVEFYIGQHETPTPVLLEEFLVLQTDDLACRQLAAQHTPDVDQNLDGVIGFVLPDGEFRVQLPASLQAQIPITIVEEPPLPISRPPRLRGDTSVLRRGVLAGIRYDFPPRGLADLVSPSEAVLAATTQTEDVLPLALQLEEIRREQAADPWCRTLISSCDADSLFDLNDAGILVRKAPLDGVEQIVVPPTLRPRLLHLEHFPRVAGHPGVTRMFRSLRRHYFWEHMASDVANTVRNCTVCAKNRISERKRTSFLKLFPASEPLEYVAVDILGPLPKTEHGNRFLLVMTDRFSKLTRTVPLRSISAFTVAKAFCDQWVFVYGAPRYVLTDNGTQFTAKFFLAVCRELGIGKVFTTAYHPQTNGQVERFNRTIVNSLRGYVSQYQNNWDEFTSAITFGYNCRIHSSLGLAPFELVLSRPPPPLSAEHPESGSELSPATEKLRFLQRLKDVRDLARQRLAEAQARYKKNYDRKIREKNNELDVGSWVFVRREVHDVGVNPKLDDPADGPFKVLGSDGHVVILQQGVDEVRVSTDRVTPAPPPAPVSSTPLQSPPPEPAENSGSSPVADAQVPDEEKKKNEEEYVFEKIVGARVGKNGKNEYKVRWFGYSRDDDTWEPASHLPEAALKRYHRRTRLPILP